MTAGGGEHDVELLPGVLVFRQGHERGDDLALRQRQQVDHRLAARLGRAQWQAVDLHLVDRAAGGEEQHRRVRADHVHAGHEVLLARRHAGAALAAATLGTIGRQRHALDVAAMGDGDDHVLARDQVLDVLLELHRLERGAPFIGELVLHLQQFPTQDGGELLAAAQDLEILGDLVDDLLEIAGDLLALQSGEPLQAQLEDGLRLRLGQAVTAVFADAAAGLVDEGDERRHVVRRPVPPHQFGARKRRVLGLANERDHRVEIGYRHGESDQGVGTLACLAQLVLGAPCDDLLAEGDEGGDHLLQVHELGSPANERQHVDADGGLKRRVAVELVQHHLGHRLASELDHHPQTVAVRLVAQIGDAVDQLLAHDFGDALQHA